MDKGSELIIIVVGIFVSGCCICTIWFNVYNDRTKKKSREKLKRLITKTRARFNSINPEEVVDEHVVNLEKKSELRSVEKV